MLLMFDTVIEDTRTILFVAGVSLTFFLLTCVAIFDVAMKNFGGIYKKAFWGLVAVIPFIGCVIYFFAGRKKGIKEK